MSLEFYQKLPVHDSLEAIFEKDLFVEVPSDWCLVIADIVGSTKSIEKGHYKNVNILGASVVAAVSNCLGTKDIPYLFGGDGSTLALPMVYLESVRVALGRVIAHGRKAFSLDLRVITFPVHEITLAGKNIRLAKTKLSDKFSQLVLEGSGVEFVETILKDKTSKQENSKYSSYFIKENSGDANLEGLECRWEPIQSKKGCFVSIVVKTPVELAFDHSSRIYREVLKEIDRVFGESSTSMFQKSQLKLTLSIAKIESEVAMKNSGKSSVAKKLISLGLVLMNFIGRIVISMGVKFAGTDWNLYARDLLKNTDREKFENGIKMVAEGTDKQCETLVAYLENKRLKGLLNYGVHKSASALLTCLVFNRQGNHVHFVDGSDGGYCEAAKKMKLQRSGP